jgi:hypothetical protein
MEIATVTTGRCKLFDFFKLFTKITSLVTVLLLQRLMSVVVYGCETWSLILWEEHRLKVFENRVLKGIFETEYVWEQGAEGDNWDWICLRTGCWGGYLRLKVFENRVLRRIFETECVWEQGAEEDIWDWRCLRTGCWGGYLDQGWIKWHEVGGGA